MDPVAQQSFGVTPPTHSAERAWIDLTWEQISRSLAIYTGRLAVSILSGDDVESPLIALNAYDFLWTESSVDGWRLAAAAYDQDCPIIGFFLVPGNAVDFANQCGKLPYVSFRIDQFTGLNPDEVSEDPNLFDLSDVKTARALEAYAMSLLEPLIKDITPETALSRLTPVDAPA